jgi:glycine cleavage system H lipoate-binding protein
MAKERTETKEIWIEKEGNKVSIGFTRDFLAGMAECWHILPATKKQVKEGVPLMMIETNSELISIASPLTGYVGNFSDKARNFPDLLTEQDVIMKLNTSPAAEKARQAAEQAAVPNMDQDQPRRNDVVERILAQQAAFQAQQQEAMMRVRAPGIQAPRFVFDDDVFGG